MVTIDRTLSEVLSMLVDGIVIKSAYFIKDNTIIAHWPLDSLDDEAIEISRQIYPVSRHDVVLLVFGRHLNNTYIVLTLGMVLLLIRLNKKILDDCDRLVKILKALSSFSENINLIITS